MKRVTMADVALKANVSKSTVSQYINSRYEYMSEETRRRIQTAIEELGYKPNFVAKSLKQKRTSTIGVIVANILHAFSTQIIRAVEDTCRESGFHAIVCNADDDPLKEKDYIEMLRAKQIDGLIVFPAGGNTDLYKEMMREQYPLVFMDRIVPGVKVDTILLDNEAASALAVEHLVDRGYKRIGMLTTRLESNITPRVERISGYKKALENHGLPVAEGYYAGVETARMQDVLERMFKSSDPPEALIAGNDLSLMEILRFLKANNLDVPAQVALVGIDEVAFSEMYHPPLTTIVQPAFEMGRKAAELLLQQIEETEKSTGTVFRFSPRMIVRQST